jgi:[ribosomal protein S18]-alanine N-acetyltransferase
MRSTARTELREEAANIRNSMPPTVRSATSADVSELAELDRETFGVHAYSPSTIRQLIEVFDGLVLLAEDRESVPRAYAFGALAAAAETGWILALSVQPKHRRLGFGRATVEELTRRLAALGALRVRLTCAPSARGALGFYADLGFIVIERIDDYLGPGRDRLVLERGLTPGA